MRLGGSTRLVRRHPCVENRVAYVCVQYAYRKLKSTKVLTLGANKCCCACL